MLVVGVMEKEVYFGDEMFLGMEFGVMFFVESENNFYVDLVFGFLLFGFVFKLKEGYNGYVGEMKDFELVWML